MTVQQRHPWPQVRAILMAALDEDRAARDAFVDSACVNNAALREEVRSLLALDDERFLELETMSPPPVPLQLGPYHLVELIGSGGMGDVYRARRLPDDRPLAIKLLPAELARERTLRLRFLREAKTVALLEHPNLVRIVDVVQVDGRDAIVMEFVQGKTLKARLSEESLALPFVLNVVRQIADGLSHAHSLGVVHRDLKPSNIILSPKEVVKILDFGIVKLLGEAKSNERLTSSGEVLGTASYMSPEQARGEPVDVRTDVFSLGCILYEMVTGRKAFPGDIVASTVAVAFEDPEPIEKLVSTPPLLVELVVHALCKDPSERLPSMEVFKSGIETVQGSLE